MKECRGVGRAIRRQTPLAGAQERHLFRCDGCRALARAERLLGQLGEFREPTPAADEDFVGRVMRGLDAATAPAPSPTAARLRWAAAILLFAAAAGYGFRAADQASPEPEQVAGSSVGLDADSGLTAFGF